jgi:hypothetical protein
MTSWSCYLCYVSVICLFVKSLLNLNGLLCSLSFSQAEHAFALFALFYFINKIRKGSSLLSLSLFLSSIYLSISH